MSEQELKDLQIYIGKRNQNQTDEQVIDHIKKINDETEYLWNGDERYWKYHAPVLFPIVGKVPLSKLFLN